MRWFQGNIVEAVTQSKARNAVFVVFIEGKDDASQKIASAIDDVDVSSKLEGDNFVSIHLESGTQTFTQFSQIYRNPSVPSLYFIGRNGSPIKIVTEAVDATALLEHISHVENVHFGKSESNEAASSQTTVASSKPSQKPPSVEEAASEAGTSSVPLDDRVERAKELLEEKRLKKQAEEEEDARQKELRRRKEGQNVQEMRRLQQEQEMTQLKEERMRDKRLEQEARQRVLEQIAQDRAARNSRNATSAPPPVVSGPAAATLSNSNEARLQFRLPDGSTHYHNFEAIATLGDVRQYIVSNITLPYQNFVLATAFPRHEFTSQDNSSTLRDLQLVPTSVILIVPAGGSAGALQNSPGLFGFAQTMLMFMTYPLTRLFSFIRVFIFGAPPPAAGTSSGSAAGTASASTQNQANNQQDRRPQRRSGGAYRRTGNSNVHRLHQSNSSSDDENNTWNGNSTQQM